ncbi:cation-translocating P-type ATPase [Massilia yuzhufengensis]|uniref:P-type Cu(+) transporter n=1 Tax=Massilia yuzhufengensis TaxID=1164594 RepID=A0A1I1ERC5_9BURK|nr:cation-translocating P-type ATPase [Massilia yuzhufengensis]SFB89685.1 Ca2+-transporting ATPase [Massilia yuzhufengensis]
MTTPGGAAAATGLDSAEAARRLARDGPNSLPDAGGRRWRRIAADAAREPMYLLLAGAALLYLLLGEPREGAFLLGMVVLMLCMTLFQEGRTERALQALRELSSPTALVWRDGRPARLPASALVAGDLVELGEGDRVPADALLLEAAGLMVDESLLTGESVPVGKLAAPGGSAPAAPGGADLPWVFSGTLVVQGHGLARVSATGARSEIGRIGAALGHIAPPPGRLQRETASLARRFALLGAAVSAGLVALLLLRGSALLQALLAGIALSMSMLPEEFPVILTVFPAIGAWRLARQQVLTRRLAAIEILGSTSVLCVDKTGTLTENRMAVSQLWRDGVAYEPVAGAQLPGPHQELLLHALRASRALGSDPMEAAFWRLAGDTLHEKGAVPAGWSPAHEYGLTPQRPALVHAWDRGDGSVLVAAKGAPETVIAMCRGDQRQREAALAAAARMAGEGLRVLAVARAVLARPAPGSWPAEPAAFGFELLGMAALADPLRPDIPAAVASCHAAGLRVIMITGDHPETARAIARQAGLAQGDVIGGAAIAALDDAALARQLAGASVCARIAPQQKLRIVQALQRGGAVVAMTGDGVNDAPALRAADVGVAMGRRGTDVAREAAELTLLDDRFASLVDAIAAGRRIFGNMRKSMCYVMAMHVPIAGMALLPVLLGWPVMLYPLHIVFLELVIDPACSLAFENEPAEPDLMRRPPRGPGEALFGRAAIGSALVQGAWVLALVVGLYGWGLARMPEAQARTLAFAGLVLCNLALLLANRQRGGVQGALRAANPVFWTIAAVALLLLAMAIFVPPAAAMLQLAPPPPATLGAAGLAAGLALAGLALRSWLAARLARAPARSAAAP